MSRSVGPWPESGPRQGGARMPAAPVVPVTTHQTRSTSRSWGTWVIRVGIYLGWLCLTGRIIYLWLLKGG